jgi:hypothetical protein
MTVASLNIIEFNMATHCRLFLSVVAASGRITLALRRASLAHRCAR